VDKIIITCTDLDGSFFVDIEVPAKISFIKLRDPIITTLQAYDRRLRFDRTRTVFLCNRTGRGIDANESMEDAGIWNGDYVTIVEV